MYIKPNQHPDSIWTWTSNKRKGKVSLWLPYLQSIEKLPKGKGDRYRFVFNGGEVTAHLKEIEFLMIYGRSGSLPIEFLQCLSDYKIPLMIHQRNMDRPYVFYPTGGSTTKDVLSAQIKARDNLIKRTYIARTLVRNRLRRFSNLIKVSNAEFSRLSKARKLSDIRIIEARNTKRYWRAYYSGLGVPKLTRRDRTHPINTGLNAGSFFLYGILLRWVLFHKLSPIHGYLHEPTNYPSLCYDLIEPYRYLIEQSVQEIYVSDLDNKAVTGHLINQLKDKLQQAIYVPATRQEVARKNLLHGIVLALRSYLLGESKRLILPVEGEKKGGRPVNLSYRLPGAI